LETSIESAIAGQVLPLRMAGTLFTGFGIVALTIAMIGLYGILAYTVGQRRREIGDQDTDVEGGFNILLGIQHTRGLFTEFKVGAIDSPEVKVVVG